MSKRHRARLAQQTWSKTLQDRELWVKVGIVGEITHVNDKGRY